VQKKVEKWINTVEILLTDPSREKEFNHFYNNMHLPDVMKTPGFVDARRFVIEEPRNGRGGYLSIYEIETDNIDETMAIRRELREKERDKGRALAQVVPDAYIVIWRDFLFKQIAELSNSKSFMSGSWINTTETVCANPSKEKEYNRFFDSFHLADVLSTQGFVSARRYSAKELRNGRGKYLAIYEIDTNDIDESMTLRRKRREKEKAQNRAMFQLVPNIHVPIWEDVLFKQIYRIRK
jgi:hypothetical protein